MLYVVTQFSKHFIYILDLIYKLGFTHIIFIKVLIKSHHNLIKVYKQVESVIGALQSPCKLVKEGGV